MSIFLGVPVSVHQRLSAFSATHRFLSFARLVPEDKVG
jgi:hypothetical protein